MLVKRRESKPSGGFLRPSEPVRRLWRYALQHKRRLFLGLLCGGIYSLCTAALAFALKEMNEAFTAKDIVRISILALGMILVYLVNGILYYCQCYLLCNVSERVAQRLRNDLFAHFQSLSLSFFESRKTGALTATISSDVPVVQTNMTSMAMEGITAPATIIVCVGYMLYTDWQLTLVALIFVPLMGRVIAKASQRMRRASEAIQKSLSDTSALATETLAAIRVVRSFGAEDRENARFEEESRRTYHANMRVVRLNAALKPVVDLLGATTIAFILWFGGLRVTYGSLDWGDLFIFLLVAARIPKSIAQINRFPMYYERLNVAAGRIFAVLEQKPEVQDAPDALTLERVEGHILFDDVHFAYANGEPVLRGLSFEVKPGEAVALVGPSGVGKSTIVGLIPRFYDVTAGSIRVDAQDVRAVTGRSLRAHIGIVAQEPVLFSGTIRDNIAYGRPDATDEEILSAARVANAHEFITHALPNGYDTPVGERGVTLSGGQRQRIAIARAILTNPRILILDEATSALDTESEALVQEALDKIMEGRSTIIIAHRLSTVRKANRILVLSEGRIHEQGSHSALIRQNGLYARLYEAGLGSANDPTDDADAADPGGTTARMRAIAAAREAGVA